MLLERRLAAILAADVVGYARLMGARMCSISANTAKSSIIWFQRSRTRSAPKIILSLSHNTYFTAVDIRTFVVKSST